METKLQVNRKQLRSLLSFVPKASDNKEKQAVYRALFLSEASDSSNIDYEIAVFTTQAELGEQERIKLFEVLENRNNVSPLYTLLSFTNSSSEESAIIVAMKATRKHITEEGVSDSRNLISNSSSKRVRDFAEQTVEDYFEKKQSEPSKNQKVNLSKSDSNTKNRNLATQP